MYDTAALAGMIEKDRVDRRIYTDPEIFELELDRIFGRAWLYLGHVSQVAAKGDFFTTRMGREKVIVSRDGSGEIHVLFNRCPHRGSQVCAEPHGNTGRFVCPYHAWSFASDGRLVGVPHVKGYEPDFRERFASLGLERVPRVDTYQGFIFASLAAEGPSLADFLGPRVREAFDNFVDRAPDGELEFVPGKLVQAYRGNWKLQIENSIDLVHPPILHRNAIDVANEFIEGMSPDAPLPTAVDIFRANGLAFDEWDEVRQYALENGHCYMESFFLKFDEEEVADPDERFGSDDQMRFEGQAEYKRALVNRHGEAKAEEILAFNRHNTIVYPNLFINPRIQQVRVLHPTHVDRTEQHCHVFGLKGAPRSALETAVAFLTASNSPSSIATTDDHEVFERVQAGLSTGAGRWLDFSRGVGKETPNNMGLEAEGTNELAMRNQHRAWRMYMTEAA